MLNFKTYAYDLTTAFLHFPDSIESIYQLHFNENLNIMKFMRKKYSLIVMVPFLGALSVGTANASPAEMRVDEINMTQQSGTCTGVVKDANGEVAIGASVVVKGTTNGVITDGR